MKNHFAFLFHFIGIVTGGGGGKSLKT